MQTERWHDETTFKTFLFLCHSNVHHEDVRCIFAVFSLDCWRRDEMKEMK
jgi:hypothetical protein